jgi:hypothetical protein
VLHDVAGGAAENHLPQPVPREGSLDQQIAALLLGRSEDRFTSAAAVPLNVHGLDGNPIMPQLLAHLIG